MILEYYLAQTFRESKTWSRQRPSHLIYAGDEMAQLEMLEEVLCMAASVAEVLGEVVMELWGRHTSREMMLSILWIQRLCREEIVNLH